MLTLAALRTSWQRWPYPIQNRSGALGQFLFCVAGVTIYMIVLAVSRVALHLLHSDAVHVVAGSGEPQTTTTTMINDGLAAAAADHHHVSVAAVNVAVETDTA